MGAPRLRLRGARRPPRWRPPAAGRLGAAAQGPAGGGGKQPGPGGGKGGTTPPLARLRRLIGRGLERTAAFWPDIECAYGWVHRAAHILGNEAGEDASKV